MSERPTLGELLTELGRVDQSDVQRALDYQAEHGGYFGEALIALGVVTAEELEWGLASQFDLPYVFPDAEAIDPEAAWLVPPEWALANLILPIAKTPETVTVVVDSPNKKGPLEDLARRVNRTIDLAIASPSKIRELIRRVFSAGTADPAEGLSAVTLSQGLGLALGAGASRFGVSARGHAAVFWWHEGGRVRRRPLDGLWRKDLDARVSPSPSEEVGSQLRAHFEARLTREGRVSPVEVDYLSDDFGSEFLFRPVEGRDELHDRFGTPPPELRSEVRLLSRSGAARLVVKTDPPTLGGDILPHLPDLLGVEGRSVHVRGRSEEDRVRTFGVVFSSDATEWRTEFEALRVFSFDVATIDLPIDAGEWLRSGLEVAPVTFVLGGAVENDALRGLGLEWAISIEEHDNQLTWSLDPVER